MKKIRFANYLKEYLDFKNISIKDFANRINITPKHLISILNGESDLSATIIENISIVTNISQDYIYRMELNYKFENTILKYLNDNNMSVSNFLSKFNYKFLEKNHWMTFTDEEDKLEVIKDILKYLRVSSPDKIYELDERILFKSKNEKIELLMLWLERCYRKTLEQQVESYKKDNIDILVNYIRKCARENIFNQDELIKMFNCNGIALVIEKDIPGSKIRGAFKVHKDVPAIYITYKHKRIADIYFALLHELAHCKSDFNKAKASNLISFEDNEIEDKADKEAYNWMVDDKYYQSIIQNKNYDISKEDNPKCFIVYRLAHDKIINYSSNLYQKYNIIIKEE